ncbi:MAG: choice-of-anchor J domain-containing protein, partial [Bacteroidetes bacterium]|nr:choice-of-anchor J domain-containing protein [Bacteroidota bacterium]
MALTTLTSYAQDKGQKNKQQVNADRQARAALKMKIENSGRTVVAAPKGANNDLGLSNRVANPNASRTARTEAICQTYTGSLGAGDLTMPTRLFRGGVASSCATPSPFPTTSAVSPFFDTYTYTNTTGLTQCGTFTLTTTDGVNANIQHGIWDGSFNPANMATNYLADPGLSTGTPQTAPLVFSRIINAGQTIVLVVWSANASTGATGTASNYTVTIDFPICSSVPCAATPAPGNTLSTVSTVCPGINFTLSLQNATSGSGVTYQWQQAASAAGPWSDIVGATGSTLTRSQTAATCYRCVVTCAGNGSGTSTPVCVALTPPSGCYCIPPASDCTDDDVILRVRLSTLDNASTCGTGPPAGYTNYTSTVAAPVVIAGAPNPLTVNVPTTFTEQVAAWIDYNQNGNFEASEYTNLGSNAAGGTLTGNINIPTTALTGVTRMRVRVRFATALGSGDACLGYTFGETEDYNVNIQPCVPITITGNPSNATIFCGSNASFSVITTGSLPTYRWEYRVNASSPWLFVPNAAPFSGVLTSTLNITNASVAYNGYQFRAVVEGGCSATDFSGAASLTVNQLVPVVNPSSATICLGSVQQLTLTNTTGNTDLISEGFNTAIPLPAGWAAQNNSTPVGTTGWFQGTPGVFTAQSGAPNAYIGANFNNVTGANTISNWLITPSVAIKNGDIFRFWTRTITGPTFPDRLEVRLNTTNTTNVGATNTSVGDFTTVLLTINPTLTATGYPSVWTQYTVTVSGLAAPVAAGRFAFRYFVTNGGPLGANSDYIGIDDVSFTSIGGPAQGVWNGPAGTLWTNAGATTPYVAGTPINTIWVTPTVTSNYTVSYTTPTPCTSATTTVPVSVVNPAVLATSPVNRTVCDGGSTTFTATATGGPLTYQWQRSIDGGLTYANISGATSSTYSLGGITLSMTGYRYRCVISAAPCAGSVTSAAAILTVNALPVVTLTSPDLLLTPGQTTSITASSTPAAAAGGWVWTYNGSTIAGNNTNTVTGINIDRTGTYSARVTDV